MMEFKVESLTGALLMVLKSHPDGARIAADFGLAPEPSGPITDRD